MISICSLIFRSTVYADSVYESLLENTPKLSTGEAEFFFIANDPTDELVQHLDRKKYRFYIHTNPKRTDEELFKMGYATPNYLHGVYRAWNTAIQLAGNIVVLVNSDMIFSPDWLENLLKWSGPDSFVCSQLVEYPGVHPVFPGAYCKKLGTHPKNFQKEEFYKFVKENSYNAIKPLGAYMPCMFYKENAMKVGCYPEGNLHGGNFNTVRIYGDEEFVRKLCSIGVRHITSMDSIVYHFKEGEMRETDE